VPTDARYRPDPRHDRLAEPFFDEVSPARFPLHILRFRNQRWAERVGLGSLDEAEWEAHFARFAPLPGNFAKPLALRYHGHQFDVYNPDLGDGRGFLFAQLRDDRDRLLDLGTKGSGRTPWSRAGDGRLTLKGGVREILATEMLEALGVYTSKTFSLFETGESLMRGDEPSPTRSSVLVRLQHSHVRIGTFQRLAYHREQDAMKRLVQLCDECYGTGPTPHALFEHVVRESIRLCASWMMAGFVHGVLNSDNMNVTGESFDYGPWRFLPKYDPAFTAAYFDEGGLYAFGKQPRAVLTNLLRLARSLGTIDEESAMVDVLRDFEPRFEAEVIRQLLARMGLRSRGEEDEQLLHAVFLFLDETQIGYEAFFFDTFGNDAERMRKGKRGALFSGKHGDDLLRVLGRFEPARKHDDRYFDRDDPCTMLIDEVEALWAVIAHGDNWDSLGAKVDEIRSMGRALAL
jgi:serine/tyrosine/threonine adenylyltransferase